MKEAGCDAVKLEGGSDLCPRVQAIVKAGIPVMGHIGLTPQTVGQLGGYKVQGKDLRAAKKMIADAKELQAAGVFALVLECVPAEVAQIIAEQLAVPVIGIGAGPGCDGQVLVTQDLLGMFEKFVPSFVKVYAHLAPQIKEAVDAFKEEVQAGSFPQKQQSFGMDFDLKELLE